MPRIALDFIALHNPLFFQGMNYSDKPKTKYPLIQLLYDTDLSCALVLDRGKCAVVPASNIASMTLSNPADFQIEIDAPIQTLPPAQAARARRAEIEESIVNLGDPNDPYDPNDPDELAAHRARVRAASANSNKPSRKAIQNDTLIQESRMIASGAKSAQVSDPTRPKDGVTGKPKPFSHEQLRAQLATEAKQVKG